MARSILLTAPAAILVLAMFSAELPAAEPDPVTHFFVDGKLIGGRGIQVGDPTDWNTGIEGFSGQSASGKVVISTDTYEAEGDAIRITFSKSREKGQFAIYGPEVDLTPYENEGALVMELKITEMARGAIMLGMDCNYPCRSESDVSRQLHHYPRNEWFTFVVPINCFSLNEAAHDFDLSRVNGPLLWSTESRLEMSVANVRLALLPVGEPGCRKD